MPCGGIYPVANSDGGTIKRARDATKGGCWVCGRGGCRHFMDEWDTYIHARCAVKELAKPDSYTAIIIGHGHSVKLDFSLEVES